MCDGASTRVEHGNRDVHADSEWEERSCKHGAQRERSDGGAQRRELPCDLPASRQHSPTTLHPEHQPTLKPHAGRDGAGRQSKKRERARHLGAGHPAARSVGEKRVQDKSRQGSARRVQRAADIPHPPQRWGKRSVERGWGSIGPFARSTRAPHHGIPSDHGVTSAGRFIGRETGAQNDDPWTRSPEIGRHFVSAMSLARRFTARTVTIGVSTIIDANHLSGATSKERADRRASARKGEESPDACERAAKAGTTHDERERRRVRGPTPGRNDTFHASRAKARMRPDRHGSGRVGRAMA